MNKQQLASKIWESANKMRSKIEANEYKDYILGFIFYKFLSETEITRLKARDFAEEDLPSLVEDDEETVVRQERMWLLHRLREPLLHLGRQGRRLRDFERSRCPQCF